MAEEILPKYRCTEQELYSIGELAIKNLEKNLPDFADYKAKYDAAFVANLRGLRDEAIDLPDVEQRNVDHQTLLNEMIKLGENCTGNMPKLMGYIEDAWPLDNPKPRNESAGYKLWKTAKAGDWEDMDGMNIAMKKFINQNNALLTAPGGMTAAFVTKVTNDATKFNDKYVLYKTARETNPKQQEKMKANNTFYDAMMAFMKEGVERVYPTDKAKQDLFTFKKLKFIVSPPGSASLKVTVMNANDTPAANAAVTIKAEDNPSITLNTDANGVAFFDKVDPATYAGSVVVNGVTTPFSKDVDTGKNSRIVIKLSL